MLPVADHAKTKARRAAEYRRRRRRDSEPARDHDDPRPNPGRARIDVDAEDRGDLPEHDVAHGIAAHARDRAQQGRDQRAQAVGEGLEGSRDGEERKGGGVERSEDNAGTVSTIPCMNKTSAPPARAAAG